jgi:hypothetical protein
MIFKKQDVWSEWKMTRKFKYLVFNTFILETFRGGESGDRKWQNKKDDIISVGINCDNILPDQKLYTTVQTFF